MNTNKSEYILKVPMKIEKKLAKVLKNSSSGLKFSDLCIKFEKRYKCKLDMFFTVGNEIILEVNSNKNDIYSEINKFSEDEYEPKCSVKEVIELRDFIKKIDFTHEFTEKSKKTLSSSSSSGNYLEIKFCCPDVGSTENGANNIEDGVISEIETDEVSNLFDKLSWKVDDIFPVFIGNIYDPSKFWIRFSPIDVFQKELWNFYNNQGEALLITDSTISIGLNCVASIENLYYRGRIIRTDIEDCTLFKVYLYDFGIVSKVHVSQLYHLHKPFTKIPEFAVRAMLTNISPLGPEMWNEEVVNRFLELTNDKLLCAKIARIHVSRKILEIDLIDSSVNTKGKIPTINYRLVCEGLAKIAWYPQIESKSKDNSEFKRLCKFLYLYPTFEMLENGLTPSQVSVTEKLKECVPCDVIFPNLYQYVA